MASIKSARRNRITVASERHFAIRKKRLMGSLTRINNLGSNACPAVHGPWRRDHAPNAGIKTVHKDTRPLMKC